MGLWQSLLDEAMPFSDRFWQCSKSSLPVPGLCSFPQGTSPVVAYFRDCLAPSRARDTPTPTLTTPTACGTSVCGTRPAGSSSSSRTWSECGRAGCGPSLGGLSPSAGNGLHCWALQLLQPVVHSDPPLPAGWKAAAAPTMPSRCSMEGPPRAGASAWSAGTTIVSSPPPGTSSPSCSAVTTASPGEASTPTTHHLLTSIAPWVRLELSFTLRQGRSSNSITKSFWWLSTPCGHPDPLAPF